MRNHNMNSKSSGVLTRIYNLKKRKIPREIPFIVGEVKQRLRKAEWLDGEMKENYLRNTAKDLLVDLNRMESY